MAPIRELPELIHPGDAIREQRIELGLTQAELADAANVSQADISRIENGLLDARWSSLQRIFAALAAPDAVHKRSLANGSRTTGRTAKLPQAIWSPTAQTLPVQHRGR